MGCDLNERKEPALRVEKEHSRPLGERELRCPSYYWRVMDKVESDGNHDPRDMQKPGHRWLCGPGKVDWVLDVKGGSTRE